jgi:hypothetical protein
LTLVWSQQMVRLHIGYISVLCALLLLCASSLAWAAEYHGQVTFGGYPVPGATVTATRGDKKVTVVSDAGGVYSFDDLADGPWKIAIEMQCFAKLEAEVTIAPNLAPGKWELTLLPIDQLLARSKLTQAPPTLPPNAAPSASVKKPDGAAAGPTEIPKAPDEQSEQANDGYLVNGSVNNAATSQYSLDRAFGNRRPNSKSLYTLGFAAVLNNSALNARPYSLTGFEAPKGIYDRVTAAVSLGGPIKIPHVLPRGPNFFAAYQWTRDNNEAIESGLVPTVAERAGDLSGTLYNPDTGLPFSGCAAASTCVPVSSQAQALLALYPLPNLSGATGYNFQVPVLNSNHQDVVQLRLDKTLGRRDQLYGGFNLQSTRAGNANLFGFVDTTDSLGINSNINWTHRLKPQIFFFASYKFSRLRTLVRPNFENRQNVSGDAGITGNDQDPANWGPPALGFSSGIAGLSDANSSFDRNRADAFSASTGIYHGKHNITAGVDFREQQYNDFFQQNPRGAFTFTGTATAGADSSGSDLADFLVGVPDTSNIAFGNADKYFRQQVFDGYATDDWRVLSVLTINAGARWEYGAPITELHGRLVNLDLTSGFAAVAPVEGSNPVGSLTGTHYPSSLIRPDRRGIEPRIGVSWRPIPASTVVVRAGYGIYHDTSVYLTPALQLAQQAPLSTSLNIQNSAACPLTLVSGFVPLLPNSSAPCYSGGQDNYAVDPNFRVGYAQTWNLAVQRDLPFALQMTATYLGVKGTHGVQELLPNTYPIGAVAPCPACPLDFEYRTSSGNSTRQSGLLQLRRRLKNGFTASLLYTWSKSIDNDAALGGQGHGSAASQGQAATDQAQAASPSLAIAQNWLNLRAERSLSTFDQRNLLNVQVQYTTGQGAGGRTLMTGWRGRLLKEWTAVTQINIGTGMPETPIYLATVPGTGFTGTIRPSLTGAPIYASSSATTTNSAHLNSAAYSAPALGQWGTAGRDSIVGPGQFSLDGSLERTFRPSTKFNLIARIDSTNTLNHAVFSSWITTINSQQFGLPSSANAMRSLQTTIRVRF